MKRLILLFICLTTYIVYLLIEQILLKQTQKQIPLRICVTGTRGKSGVVRMIATVLSESGIKVLAKVTGSKPVVILPDGRETAIRRFGPASILEQIRILKLARKLQVDAVVLEIMSINPENHYIESCKIINPHIVAITNIRLDHTEKMGASRDEIAATIGLTIPRSSMVFVNEDDYFEYFKKIAQQKQATVMTVPRINNNGLEIDPKFKEKEFIENIELVLAIADFLGLDRKLSLEALTKTKPDFGSLRVWEFQDETGPNKLILINAFAANDPESTKKVFEKCKVKFNYETDNVIGMINLRSDRPERTLQWCNTLLNTSFLKLKKILLIGDKFACQYMQRKLRHNRKLQVSIISEAKPEKIMNAVFKNGFGYSVVFGFGNIKGVAEKLVNYWDCRGRKIE